ncbi:MAG: amidohydrolase, partial [Lachnospiraceae bacterium]|nr:amidohydrolase [Lachnospiraceae bacterium]
MSRIRIYNAIMITMEDGSDILKDGVLTTEGERISYVGSTENEPHGVQYDREIDAGGNIIMPGFKDAHTHSGM